MGNACCGNKGDVFNYPGGKISSHKKNTENIKGQKSSKGENSELKNGQLQEGKNNHIDDRQNSRPNSAINLITGGEENSFNLNDIKIIFEINKSNKSCVQEPKEQEEPARQREKSLKDNPQNQSPQIQQEAKEGKSSAHSNLPNNRNAKRMNKVISNPSLNQQRSIIDIRQVSSSQNNTTTQYFRKDVQDISQVKDFIDEINKSIIGQKSNLNHQLSQSHKRMLRSKSWGGLISNANIDQVPLQMPTEQQKKIENNNTLEQQKTLHEKLTQILSKEHKNQKCFICNRQIKNQTIAFLICNHFYHEDCILPFLQCGISCPLCQKYKGYH